MNNKKNIDKNAHYFLLMHPLEGIVSPFASVLYTSDNSREKWVECEIIEENYKIDDGNKIELKPLENGYGNKIFYINSFLGLLNAGYIVKKLPDMCCVEEKWIEPLTDNLALHHSAYTLKIKRKK